MQVLLGGDDAPVPESFLPVWRSAPPARSQEAWAWRRSWVRTRMPIPAVSSAGFQMCSRNHDLGMCPSVVRVRLRVAGSGRTLPRAHDVNRRRGVGGEDSGPTQRRLCARRAVMAHDDPVIKATRSRPGNVRHKQTLASNLSGPPRSCVLDRLRQRSRRGAASQLRNSVAAGDIGFARVRERAAELRVGVLRLGPPESALKVGQPPIDQFVRRVWWLDVRAGGLLRECRSGFWLGATSRVRVRLAGCGSDEVRRRPGVSRRPSGRAPHCASRWWRPVG